MELKDLTPREMEIVKAITSQGFTINSGLAAVQLDEFAKLAYNVHYPELKKIPHITPDMYGQPVGSDSFSWKNLRNPNATSLPAAVSPGNRNQVSSIATQKYSAPYCTLGFDQSIQDEEVEQEKGFDDPLKLARITTMHNILRNYDILVTGGNRGPDSNGFALGSGPLPGLVASTTSAGNLPGSTNVSVVCVELTAYAMQPYSPNFKATSGLTPFAVRTPANASVAESIPTGIGMPSSTATLGTSTHNTMTATVVPSVGAFGWAWFVEVTGAGSPPEADLYFAGITSVPSIVITDLPAGTQSLTAFEALQDGIDTSYNGLDGGVSNSPAPEFDGAFAFISTYGAGNFVKMAGSKFHADGFGGVTEIENAILAQYDATQAVPDELVLGVDAVEVISQAVFSSSSSSNLRQLKDVGADGGAQASGYIRSYVLKFSPDGNQRIIPVSVNVNIPRNAVWLPTRTNPYPTTSATIPANMQLVERKQMYSENFAKTRRTWEIGTYVQPTLAVRAPEIGIVMSGADVSALG